MILKDLLDLTNFKIKGAYCMASVVCTHTLCNVIF